MIDKFFCFVQLIESYGDTFTAKTKAPSTLEDIEDDNHVSSDVANRSNDSSVLFLLFLLVMFQRIWKVVSIYIYFMNIKKKNHFLNETCRDDWLNSIECLSYVHWYMV